MNPAAQKEMLELESQFSTGDRGAITRGLLLCAIHEAPLPPWLASAWIEALDTMQDFREKDWNKLFPRRLPSHAHLRARRRKLELRPKIVEAIKQEIERGTPIDENLFETVGLRFGIKKTLCSEIYYQSITAK